MAKEKKEKVEQVSTEGLSKKQRIEAVKAKLEKDFGEGTIMGATQKPTFHEFISTGSLGLDKALGIGGIPKGRIVEVYGPESSGKTTLCLELIVQAHLNPDSYCAFIDTEHSIDLEYAKNLGVDLERLELSQPDYGEQALEVADRLIESGDFDIVIVDSVASLVPKSELEGEMGDSAIGKQARLMSQALRKLVAKTEKSKTILIFTNQLREKIGVMFGCFHYDARVLLEDGSTEKIGKIVNNKLNKKVLSYNSTTKKLEPKNITGWFNNGKAGKFIQYVVKNPYKCGTSNLPIGDDHIFITPNGDKLASTLSVGDKVFIKSLNYFNSYQNEILLGSILGDGSIKNLKNNLTSSFRLGHGIKQNDYCKWKFESFSKDSISSNGYTKDGKFWFQTKTTTELKWLSKYKSKSALQFLDNEIIDKITKLSIAIWYMDDGTFSGSYKKWGNGKSRIYCTKLDESSKEKLSNKFIQLGFPKPTIDDKGFIFYGEDSFKFQNLIKQYIHPSMDYKIHPKLRGMFIDNNLLLSTSNKPIPTLIETEIIKIYDKPKNKQTLKFDIEVEDNHNYFVDNVLVHNSPEVTTGGNALKFYASIRLDIRKIEQIKEEEVAIANRVRVKVVKNKVAPPFRQAEFPIIFGEGIDVIGETLDIATDLNVIQKSGSWFSYNETRLGQGRAFIKKLLTDNVEMFEEIKQKTLALYNPKQFAGEE